MIERLMMAETKTVADRGREAQTQQRACQEAS